MDRESIRRSVLLGAVRSLQKHDELQQALAHNCKSFEECSNSTDACGEGIYFLCLAHLMQGTLEELFLSKAQNIVQRVSGVTLFIVEGCLPFLLLFFFFFSQEDVD